MKETSENTAKTYFYVFVQKEISEYVQKKISGRATKDISKSVNKAGNGKEISNETELLDDRVTQAFLEFQNAFADETDVTINPKQFHEYRNIFGITKLPAFGVYKKDLSYKVGKAKPERLPGPLEFWNRKKRKQIMAAMDWYPMVERNALKQFEDVESILNFISDLHMANMDFGLKGVVAIIERKNTEITGKKTGEMFKMGKDFIKFW